MTSLEHGAEVQQTVEEPYTCWYVIVVDLNNNGRLMHTSMTFNAAAALFAHMKICNTVFANYEG